MLEYDRIDISEGIDINKKKHLENVVYVSSIISYVKIVSMDHFYVMVVMICL